MGDLLTAVEHASTFRPDDKCWSELCSRVAGQASLIDRLEALTRAHSAAWWSMRAAELRVDVDPLSSSAWYRLGVARLGVWDLADARHAFERSAELGSFRLQAHSQLAYLTLFDQPASAVSEAHKQWGCLYRPIVPHHRDPQARSSTRLRVGYVAHNLSSSPEAHFILPLLQRHSPDRFRVFAYSDRVSHVADGRFRWRPTASLDWKALYRLIRRDRIDVLLNIDGHLDWRSMLAFAARAAPVQAMTPLYPCSSGLAEMDFRLSDGSLDCSTSDLVVERAHHLSGGCLWYPPPSIAPDIGGLPMLRNGFCTFGVFANPLKLTAALMAVWAEILGEIPKSRLLVHHAFPNAPGATAGVPEMRFEQALLKRLDDNGIDTRRVTIIGSLSHWDHLDLFNEVDLILDTFPFTGYTTTFESLWMGVPVVSLRGVQFVERISSAILTEVGLADFVADSVDAYRRASIERSSDVDRLSTLRCSLRASLRDSSMTDLSGYVLKLEQAFYAWSARPRSS